MAILGTFLAFTGPLEAQDVNDHVMTILTDFSLGISATDPATRRMHHVNAAYAARRILEDHPDSPSAIQLRGSGFEMFGSDPLSVSVVDEAMTAGCIAAPDALCLVDIAYTFADRAAQEVLSEMLPLKEELGLGDASFQDILFLHRSSSAMAYADLDLDQRVRDTFAHHVRHDGQLSVIERIYAAPDYAYALARIGDVAAAEQIGPDLEALITDPGLVDVSKVFLSLSDLSTMIGSLGAGDPTELDIPIAPELIWELSELLSSAYRRTGNLELVDFAADKLTACPELQADAVDACRMAFLDVLSKAGQVDAVRVALQDGDRRDPLFMAMIAARDTDAALAFFEAELADTRNRSIRNLVAALDPSQRTDAEASVMVFPEGRARHGAMGNLAAAYARVGHVDTATAYLSGIDNEGQRLIFTGIVLEAELAGLAKRGAFSEAASRLQEVEPRRRGSVGWSIAEYALRAELDRTQ